MTWDRGQPTNPKYRSPEHRAYLAGLKRDLNAQGYLICAAPTCKFDGRVITNPNGLDPDGLTAGHLPDGQTYNGPEHRACNLHEAAVRANRRSHGRDLPTRWVL